MRRYLMWTFWCIRGRRCADVEMTTFSGSAEGVVVLLDYVCEGCGTSYRREVISGKDGSFVQTERAIRA